MNDFSELENQLRKLRPIQPSENLAARIESALAESESTCLHDVTARQARTAGILPRVHQWRVNWLALGLGLSAAALFLIFARLGNDRPAKKMPAVASMTPVPFVSPTNESTRFVPAALTQVVYRTRDEGLQFPGGSQEPMRCVRSHKRETLQWRNPNTGASLRVSYPSEEVTLIPVSGQ
jgi:hypothetical protein